MNSRLQTEGGNPTASPQGGTQQTKHFQRGSATVLCSTVNFAGIFYCAAFCSACAADAPGRRCNGLRAVMASTVGDWVLTIH
jgi:hypothetical protein